MPFNATLDEVMRAEESGHYPMDMHLLSKCIGDKLALRHENINILAPDSTVRSGRSWVLESMRLNTAVVAYEDKYGEQASINLSIGAFCSIFKPLARKSFYSSV